MADTHIEVNGKCVGEYDICDKPCVKSVNGSGPDDCGNVKVDGGGPTINGGYDVTTPLAPIEENVTSGELFANSESIWNLIYDSVGAPVVVTFDGVDYQCVVKDTSGYPPYVIGDTNFVECPFYIIANFLIDSNPMCRVALYTASDGESHTVKIQAYKSAPVVFDKKYIPSMEVLTGADRITNDDIGVYMTTRDTYNNKRSVGFLTCDSTCDVFAPLQFTRHISTTGQATNCYKSEGRTYSSLETIINGGYRGRVVATCVVVDGRSEAQVSDGSKTVEVYFASKTKLYTRAVQEDKRGILFTFVSLYDSSDKFELFLKSDGTVVEDDPNTTTDS